MKKQPPWIHRFDDDRGVRKVLLDGVEVEKVLFADTQKGVIERYCLPLTPDKDGNLATEVLHGQVEVIPWPSTN